MKNAFVIMTAEPDSFLAGVVITEDREYAEKCRQKLVELWGGTQLYMSQTEVVGDAGLEAMKKQFEQNLKET